MRLTLLTLAVLVSGCGLEANERIATLPDGGAEIVKTCPTPTGSKEFWQDWANGARIECPPQ